MYAVIRISIMNEYIYTWCISLLSYHYCKLIADWRWRNTAFTANSDETAALHLLCIKQCYLFTLIWWGVSSQKLVISGHDADSRGIVQMRFGRRQAANDEGHGDFGNCVGVVMRGRKQFYERRFGGSGAFGRKSFGPLLEGFGSPTWMHGGVSARADSVRAGFDTTAIAVIVRP